MAKIAAESRELFNSKMKPYKETIDKSYEKEKNILQVISKDSSGVAYKKFLLAEEIKYISKEELAKIIISLRDEKIKSGRWNG